MKQIFTLLLLIGTLHTFAQPGSLDVSFGNNGIYSDTTPYIFEASFCGALQPDGKILIGGYCQISAQEYNWLVRRLNADGTVDTSFGAGGDARLNFNNSPGYVTNIAILPGGKLLLIGYVPAFSGGLGKYALARLNADGSIDNTFGNGGTVLDSLGVDAILGSMVIAPNGNIFTCGAVDTGQAVSGYRFFVASFTPTGQRNTNFGGSGRVLLSLGYPIENLGFTALQADGKILVAGEATKYPGSTDAVVFRLNPDGTLDNSFGNNGHFLHSAPPLDERGWGLLLHSNGKIVVTGTEMVDFNTSRLLVIQLNSDGTLDPNFATGGIFTSDTNMVPFATASVLLEQNDGRILAVGVSDQGNMGDFTVYRLTTSGTLDPSFGTGGWASTDLNNGTHDIALGAFLQTDQLLVVTGHSFTNSNSFAAARYHVDSGTGLSSPDSEAEIQVYPNPAGKYLHISTVQPEGSMRIVDLQGRTVLERSVDQKETSLDVSALVAGVYLVLFNTDDTQTAIPWVKQ